MACGGVAMQFLMLLFGFSCAQSLNFRIEPTGFTFEDSYFSYYPVNKDLTKYVSFELYTKKNPSEPHIIQMLNKSSLSDSPMNLADPTVFFLHGFLESSKTPDGQSIKNAFMQRNDSHNVILVNMKYALAGPWYFNAVENTIEVGKIVANFIKFLVFGGVSLPSIYIIGHSLGAHVAGNTGSSMTIGRIERITGLDPAGPFFKYKPNSEKLDPTDANFVDVIHTDAGLNGYPFPSGHLDFWPNGGSGCQPGCSQLEITKRDPMAIPERIFCSHWKSYQWYAESVLFERKFPAVKCNNWPEFINGCIGNQQAFMGYRATNRSSGNYYLRIESESSRTGANNFRHDNDNYIPMQDKM